MELKYGFITEILFTLTSAVIPLVAVIISWRLATKTAEEKYSKSIKKDIYDNYHSDILKLCYGLPSPRLLDFMSFYSYYHEDKLSGIVVKNFTYISPSIINHWTKYNLALKWFNHDYEDDPKARDVLSKFLNYYSHLIITKSLKESEKLSEELQLPQLSTQLLSPLMSIDFYKSQLPTQKLIQEYHLQELIPDS